MAAQLNDEMATQIMGEIDVLTNKIGHLNQELKTRMEDLPSVADSVMNAAGKKAVGELSQEVAHLAKKIAGDAAAEQKSRSFAVAVGVSIAGAMVCIGLGFGAGLGWNKLNVEGIRAATKERIEKAERDTGWMKTEEGKAAKNLAESGEAVRLNNCTGLGWEKKGTGKFGMGGTTCYPFTFKEDNLLYGWKIKN